MKRASKNEALCCLLLCLMFTNHGLQIRVISLHILMVTDCKSVLSVYYTLLWSRITNPCYRFYILLLSQIANRGSADLQSVIPILLDRSLSLPSLAIDKRNQVTDYKSVLSVLLFVVTDYKSALSV